MFKNKGTSRRTGNKPKGSSTKIAVKVKKRKTKKEPKRKLKHQNQKIKIKNPKQETVPVWERAAGWMRSAHVRGGRPVQK